MTMTNPWCFIVLFNFTRVKKKKSSIIGKTSKFNLTTFTCSCTHTRNTLEAICTSICSPTGKNRTTSSLQSRSKCSNGAMIRNRLCRQLTGAIWNDSYSKTTSLRAILPVFTHSEKIRQDQISQSMNRMIKLNLMQTLKKSYGRNKPLASSKVLTALRGWFSAVEVGATMYSILS